MRKYQDMLAAESEDVTWIQLAHERIQQLAVVRMVMDCSLPKNHRFRCG